ncbi:MAG: hypothetical protein COZ06_19980 [Armatimonadetes bacterium CG_4_10_14_3_um_filter_66_18]|nr:MAG: hypothetical protein COS65_19345 [Armatimonadetes bacterium CG06_land_8_20_14_3_00_66_21]PIX45611.1 MAG: hypothetical protein COZ57_14835 [Armatimonadetes bacterium CG_4_8_14_3_um_filter_66_20]PIY44702.1 MAG: hypothetical protein COZ06_19980 [Armatimonadetes bacterium CG_4_10_14_3_um_filter_66_18]PJB60169.1 MAG: hypothetical protein CO096_35310 [Armatimonadetes bacterium CG_4_9_14_3_um_filter_66_14]
MPNRIPQNVVSYAKAISAHRKLNAAGQTIAEQTEEQFDADVAAAQVTVDAVLQNEIEGANLRATRDESVEALLTLCDRYVDRMKSDHERDSQQVRTLPTRPGSEHHRSHASSSSGGNGAPDAGGTGVPPPTV